MSNSITSKIERPVIVVDEPKVRQHIQLMADKARRNHVSFCPHFKTHQSAVVGNWFRDYGVTSITVSSLDMALYFAENGWRNITIALPVNLRQLDRINALAGQISLSLLVESTDAIGPLQSRLTNPVGVWLSIDTGYEREGIDSRDWTRILALGHHIRQCSHLNLRGLMAHSGHTYDVHGKQAVSEIYLDTLVKITQLRSELVHQGLGDLLISVGDTPSCSLVDEFGDVDEIRPGTFVFYDLLQTGIGSCGEADIAVAAGCPVVGIYPQRNEIAIYGGGAHLSKDYIPGPDGAPCFGRVVRLEENRWGASLPDTSVTLLYQELGLIKTTPEILGETWIGDLLLILPAHVCLLVSTLRRFITLEGQSFACMPV